MGRRPCCAKEGLNRGSWSAWEDKILVEYVKTHGEGNWRDLPQLAGLKRCGKSCRLRWLNYLKPDIKRGNISPEEDELIIRLHKLLGNRWSLIAGRLPGRTDNEIKNYWNTNLSKRMVGDKKQSCNRNPTKLKKLSECTRNFSSKLINPEITSEPHQVIRTKAVRCAKVIIPPQQNNQTADQKDLVSKSDCAVSNSRSSSSLQDDFLTNFDIDELLIGRYAINLDSNQEKENNIEDGDNIVVSEEYASLANLEALDLESIMSFLNSED